MAPATPPNRAPPSVLSCAAARSTGAQIVSASSAVAANFVIMSILQPVLSMNPRSQHCGQP
jgi:hypothetical protein